MKTQIVLFLALLVLMSCGPQGIKDVRVQVDQKNSESKQKLKPMEVYLRNGNSEGTELKLNSQGIYELADDFVVQDKAPLWFVVKYNDLSVKPKTMKGEWTVLGEDQQASLIPLQNKTFEESSKKEFKLDLFNIEDFNRNILSLNTPIQLSFWDGEQKNQEIKAEFKLRAPFPLIEKHFRQEFAPEVWANPYPAEVFGEVLYHSGLKTKDWELSNTSYRPMKLFVQYFERPTFKVVTRVTQLAPSYLSAAPIIDLYSVGTMAAQQITIDITNDKNEVQNRVFELPTSGAVEFLIPPRSKVQVGLVVKADSSQGYIGFRGDDYVHLCAYKIAQMDACRADYYPRGMRIEGQARSRINMAEANVDFSDLTKSLKSDLARELWNDTQYWSAQIGKEVDESHFQSPIPFYPYGSFFLRKPGLSRPKDL